ncbi:glycosyltransferase family 4 protein [Nocardioidaceae bacterium]|nr:glycosyltransferase family 4 protein [Nocardioidaceae bacterium]
MTGTRILHVAQPTDAGVAHVAVDEAARQAAAGHDVHLACPDGELVELARRAGLTRHAWQATRSPGPSTLREARALARIVGSVDPDLVHLHSAKAGLAGRLAVRGRRPTVFMPHAWSWNGADGPVSRLAERWERLAARWTDVVVCVSEAERDDGRAHGVRAPMTVLPNWVDLAELGRDLPGSRAAARGHLGVGAEPLAVCVGRLAQQKGQDVLLAAWPQVREALPTAGLVLVGDGPERTAVEAAAARLEGVRVLGARPRTECLTWSRAADVVVVPSRYEGMALVPLEAAALGTAVVASDVEGMAVGAPDRVRRLVPVEDVDALGKALVEALRDRDRAAAHGEEAAAWSRVHGTRAADAMLQVYADVLEARDSSSDSRRA